MNSSENENYSETAEDSDMTSLRKVWNSMFNAEIVRPIRGNNSEVQGTVMLLETAIFNIKRYSSEVVSLQTKNKKIMEELDITKKECLSLKDEIKSLKSAPCSNCMDLIKKLSDQQREISDTRKRIQSIASILSMDNVAQPSNPETQTALMMMSEMLVTSDKLKKSSPDRKKINKNLFSISPVRGEIVAAEKSSGANNDTRMRISPKKDIPEAQDVDNEENGINNVCLPLSENRLHRTPPKKEEAKKRLEENSPILDQSAKRKKGLSLRSQNEVKRLVINLSQESKVNEVCSPLSSNNSSCQQMSPSVLVKRLSPATSPKRKVSPKKNKTNSTWALKHGKYMDNDSSFVKADKKLKQTTLSLKPVEVKNDITKLKVFNGGMHSLTSDNVDVNEEAQDTVQSDDDVIQTSPGVKRINQNTGILNASNTAKSKQEKNKLPVVELDETVFNPLAASTCKLDSSFDRIPGRERRSPDYKYQRDAVRKKSERMKLEGWDCDNCAEYYKTAGKFMNQAEIKKMMNRCSRHRNKYRVRSNTPPGFWDPEFPPSEDEEEVEDKMKKQRGK